MFRLIDDLESLIRVLEMETEALVEGDREKLELAIEEKFRFVKKLEQISTMFDIEDDDYARQLVAKIDSLQETNLMLVQQAYNHNEVILEAIKYSLKGQPNTYSKTGTYEKENQTNLIDKSL